MNTDKQLLEEAAMVCGVKGEYRTETLLISGDWVQVSAIFLDDDSGYWNPIEDDGDALRLAVDMDVLFSLDFSRIHSEELESCSCKYSAVRLAVVKTVIAMSR